MAKKIKEAKISKEAIKQQQEHEKHLADSKKRIEAMKKSNEEMIKAHKQKKINP